MKKSHKILAMILLIVVVTGIALYMNSNKKACPNNIKKSEPVSTNSNTKPKNTNVKQELTGKIVSVSDSNLVLEIEKKQTTLKISRTFPPLVVKKDEKHIEVKGDQGAKDRFNMLKPGITVTVHLGPNIEEINQKTKEAIGSPEKMTAEQYIKKLKEIQNKLYGEVKKDFVDYVIIN